MTLDFSDWANREYQDAKECLNDLKNAIRSDPARKKSSKVTDTEALSVFKRKVSDPALTSQYLGQMQGKFKLLKSAVAERQKTKVSQAMPVLGFIYNRMIIGIPKSHQLDKIETELVATMKAKFTSLLETKSTENYFSEMSTIVPRLLQTLQPKEQKEVIARLVAAENMKKTLNGLFFGREATSESRTALARDLFNAGLLYIAIAKFDPQLNEKVKEDISQGIYLALKATVDLLPSGTQSVLHIPLQPKPDSNDIQARNYLSTEDEQFLNKTVAKAAFALIVQKLGYTVQDCDPHIQAAVCDHILARFMSSYNYFYAHKTTLKPTASIDIPTPSKLIHSELTKEEAMQLDLMHIASPKRKISQIAKIIQAPQTCAKAASVWTWKKLSTFGWVERFREKGVLQDVASSVNRSITPAQSKVALHVILKWMKGEPLASYQVDFIEKLLSNGYLKKVDQAPIEALQLHLSTGTVPDQSLQAVMHSQLLYPHVEPGLLHFSQEEMEVVNRFCESPKSEPSVDATQSFQMLIDILHDPKKVAALDQLSQINRHQPFKIGSRLVTRELLNQEGVNDWRLTWDIKQMAEYLNWHGRYANLLRQTDVWPVIMISMISYLVTPHLGQIKKEALTSPEARAALELIQKFPYRRPGISPRSNATLWIDLEGRLDVLKRIRQRFSEGSKTITLSEIILVNKILDLLARNSSDDFFKANPDWPCAIMQEVKAWRDDMFPLLKSVDLRDGLKESIESGEIYDLLEKITNSVKENTISEKNKLTYKEFRSFRKLAEQVHEHAFIDATKFPDFNKYEELLAQHKGEPYIRVCLFYSDPEKDTELSAKHLPWKERIQNMGVLAIHKLYQLAIPYGHANFLIYDGHNYSSHGCNVSGIYHSQISGRFHPAAATFDIDPTALMPRTLTDAQKAKFKERFLLNLTELICKERQGFSYPKHPFKHFLKGQFTPTTVQPVKLVLDPEQKPEAAPTAPQKKELFCSEFVCQAIIEAQVKTCKQMGITPPATLSIFGMRNTDAVTPNDLRSIFESKKILIRTKSALSR